MVRFPSTTSHNSLDCCSEVLFCAPLLPSLAWLGITRAFPFYSLAWPKVRWLPKKSGCRPLVDLCRQPTGMLLASKIANRLSTANDEASSPLCFPQRDRRCNRSPFKDFNNVSTFGSRLRSRLQQATESKFRPRNFQLNPAGPDAMEERNGTTQATTTTMASLHGGAVRSATCQDHTFSFSGRIQINKKPTTSRDWRRSRTSPPMSSNSVMRLISASLTDLCRYDPELAGCSVLGLRGVHRRFVAWRKQLSQVLKAANRHVLRRFPFVESLSLLPGHSLSSSASPLQLIQTPCMEERGNLVAESAISRTCRSEEKEGEKARTKQLPTCRCSSSFKAPLHSSLPPEGAYVVTGDLANCYESIDHEVRHFRLLQTALVRPKQRPASLPSLHKSVGDVMPECEKLWCDFVML